jgi:hypothetical protein
VLVVRIFFVTISYFVFGITMVLVLTIIRLFMGAKTGEGTVPIRSFKVWNWYNYNGLILAIQTLFGKFARSNALYVMFLRAMGENIGKNVIVNSNVVSGHGLLNIGDNNVIGGDAAIIGQYTNVFPRAVLGDNCYVGAMSLVPKGARLDGNAGYGGVPVRKLKDLAPGETSSVAQQSDAGALAIELEKSSG